MRSFDVLLEMAFESKCAVSSKFVLARLNIVFVVMIQVFHDFRTKDTHRFQHEVCIRQACLSLLDRTCHAHRPVSLAAPGVVEQLVALGTQVDHVYTLCITRRIGCWDRQGSGFF
jgi:hypothetical protein